MDMVQVFNSVKEEYDERIAILLTSAMAVAMTKKAKQRHFRDQGLYTRELHDSINDLLWEEVSEEERALVCDLINVYHDYQSINELGGLGDGVPVSLKQLVDEKRIADERRRQCTT